MLPVAPASNSAKLFPDRRNATRRTGAPSPRLGERHPLARTVFSILSAVAQLADSNHRSLTDSVFVQSLKHPALLLGSELAVYQNGRARLLYLQGESARPTSAMRTSPTTSILSS